MKIGTKSVLFGAHCFFMHPFILAFAWWKLYGFPWDLRLWVAFFVHDLGYWGKPNMDGEEGELHPYLGANIMGYLFDKRGILSTGHWYYFTLYHSRFLAKKEGGNYSRLCVADKLAIALTPNCIYLPMVNWTGEINEYMKDAAKNSNHAVSGDNGQKAWINGVKDYVRKWVIEHKDLKEDNWTVSDRSEFDKNGVYK